MGCLPNVNPFSKGNIVDNPYLAELIKKHLLSERRKRCVGNSEPSLILALNKFTFRLDQINITPAQDMR